MTEMKRANAVRPRARSKGRASHPRPKGPREEGALAERVVGVAEAGLFFGGGGGAFFFHLKKNASSSSFLLLLITWRAVASSPLLLFFTKRRKEG